MPSLYRVVFFLGRHVGVPLAPVVVDLLLLLLVQPHQLFSGGGDEGVELGQVAQAGLRGVLRGRKVHFDAVSDCFSARVESYLHPAFLQGSLSKTCSVLTWDVI